MEVEGQWTQRWAGAAEYGKFVGLGGVQRTARALEVLDARGPGARLRVVRTAFRSQETTSTRFPQRLDSVNLQQITDLGSNNALRSPSLLSKSTKRHDRPVSISELESSSSVDEVPYKVTEPDDDKESVTNDVTANWNNKQNTSDWRHSSIFKNSLQSIGEQSINSSISSELDGKGIFSDIDNFIIKPSLLRLPSMNAEQSLKEIRGKIRELSLGTSSSNEDSESPKEESSKVRSFIHKMEGKAITNGTHSLEKRLSNPRRNDDDWYLRRKSYGFENMASPQIENPTTINIQKDSLESSTDSGISRSIEITETPVDSYYNRTNHKQKSPTEDEDYNSFQDWLTTHKKTPNFVFEKILKVSDDSDDALKRHSIAIDNFDRSLSLKSVLEPRKTSFKPPKNSFNYLTNGVQNGDEANERRNKKVGFCKTELHIATESGQVDIVETDDKPPPSNNFRRRRRNGPFITENSDELLVLTFGTPDLLTLESDFKDCDLKINYATETEVVKSSSNVVSPDWIPNENDSQPKGILKNKPIKPKPYHLGADRELGNGGFETNHEQNLWGIKLKPVDRSPVSKHWKTTFEHEKKFDDSREADLYLEDSRECDEIEDSLPTLSSCAVVARIQNVQKQNYVESTASVDTGMRMKSNDSVLNEINKIEENKIIVPIKTATTFNNKSPKMSPVPTKKLPVRKTPERKESTPPVDKTKKVHKGKSTSSDVYLPSMNPSLYKSATRKLREHELTYFGVKKSTQNERRRKSPENKPDLIKTHSPARDRQTMYESRKHSRRSRSDDEAPLYENLLRNSSPPIPIPAPRTIKNISDNFGLNSTSKVLEILNGYEDARRSSDDDNENRYKKHYNKELDTISELSKSSDRNRASKVTKEKHSSKSLERESAKPRSRRLYKISSRENLLQSRSSSEDAPQRPVIRKKTTKRGKTVQTTATEATRDSSPATIAHALISKLNSLDKHAKNRCQSVQNGVQMPDASRKTQESDKIYGLTKTKTNHYQLLDRIKEMDDYGATAKNDPRKNTKMKPNDNSTQSRIKIAAPGYFTDSLNIRKTDVDATKQKHNIKDLSKKKEVVTKKVEQKETKRTEKTSRVKLSGIFDSKKDTHSRSKKSSPELIRKKISSRR